MSKMNSSNKIVSGMVWRFGEKITAQSVSLIVSIVLARILMPEDYGIVAIVNIFIAIATFLVIKNHIINAIIAIAIIVGTK